MNVPVAPDYDPIQRPTRIVLQANGDIGLAQFAAICAAMTAALGPGAALSTSFQGVWTFHSAASLQSQS